MTEETVQDESVLEQEEETIDPGDVVIASIDPPRLLDDPIALFNLTRKILGILSGLVVVAVGISFTMFHVYNNQPINVFVSIMLAWSGYLFAHYVATGKFIHQKQEQHLLPHSHRKLAGSLFGVLILVAGATIWIFSWIHADVLTTILGVMTMLIGYLITHYELTGELL